MIDSKLTTDIDELVVGAGPGRLAPGWALGHAGLSFMIVHAADDQRQGPGLATTTA
jgi:cation diffusion facilitator CzcD-associated flavoprotein CzcO